MASGGRGGMRVAAAALACICAAGCTSVGPQSVQDTRLQYNEMVKRTAEEQLLLNIVRLRYTDTPSSLAVSAIAAQFERVQSFQITPFFAATGGDVNHSFAGVVLPQAGVQAADRPTLSLTPLDDQEFTRKLFTPLPLDGIVYLAKTTWPIATVFRLYLENLNWVPNAQTASGPTPQTAPPYGDFRRGIEALQILQDRAQIVFGAEERSETVGGPLPAASVTGRDAIEAAKNGLEYRPDEKGATWSLVRKNQQPVLRISPEALDSLEMRTVISVFKLKPGLDKYDITQEILNPFRSTYPAEGVTNIDLETRSLLQALYFVSHGIEVPEEHVSRGLVRTTLDQSGKPFDWRNVTSSLFSIHSAAGKDRPPGAHVAIQYHNHWFYIDETDHATKSTFSLLMELARLELSGKTGQGPLLTLPIGGR